MRSLLRLLTRLLLLVIVFGLGAGVWVWYRYDREPVSFASLPVRIQVAKGAGPISLANEFNRKGAGLPPWLVRFTIRLHGGLAGIRSGIYQFDRPVSLKEILDKLASGDVTQEDVRFIEGWTFRQMRALVDQNPDLKHDSAGMTDQQILQKIGAPEASPEGLFFPSTYFVAPGSSDLDLFRLAYRQMHKVLDDAWANRAPGLPFDTPYQALVMASIVEKETGREEDRSSIAAVFVNRLKRGMMLQSDPTTIYGLGERFDGNLRKRDLQTDTPYNTYTRTGLPPTPIAAPGRAALVATLQPAPIAALYFVSRGDGTTEFSNDLSAHNRAVSRFQLKR